MQSLSIITTRDSRYWGIFQNFNMELLRLQCFFGTDSELWDNSMLLLLDQALQYRSVSVMSDEPLCIATLLGLDISQVLEQVNHDERMQKLWILISEKFGGISAGIAFYEDNTLASQGWRWASRSLIPSENSSIEAHYRSARWKQERLGEPTAIGLRISRSGFLLKQKHYDDGLPLHPWPGIRTRPERRVLFRDGSGKKFAIYDSFRSQHWDSWSTQTREEYDEKHQRPISRAILRGGSAVVLVDGLYNSHFTAHDRTRQGDSGLLVGRNTYIKENGQELAGEIVAEKYMRVILAALYPTDEIVQDTFERLANRLRCSEITKELAAIEDHESIHYKIKLETLEESMRKMVDEALDSNSQFREAMKVMFTPGGIENSWLAISSWFLASEYIGVMLEEDQVVRSSV
jgi:hypothetical protein